MDIAKAQEKLNQCGQVHLLKYYKELDADHQKLLLEQIEKTDFSIIDSLYHQQELIKKGVIEPLPVMQISEIEENGECLRQAGLNAILNNQVGAVLLAGGMGTRLGSESPKGVFNIGITHDLYIFECLIHNLMEIVKEAGRWIYLFVMTSEKNHSETVAFFEKHNYFGYEKEYIYFFMQDMAPAVDRDGKVFLEAKDRISTSPNGNGGWFISMARNGILDIVHRTGIEWLNVFSVDNVLQRIADPSFIGGCIKRQCMVGAKVVRKANPDEKVGVMCLEDGRPSIVEYYDLTDEMRSQKNEKGELAYNFGVILNYLFRVSELEKIMSHSLPLHVVEKKINYLDEDGNPVQPEEPNGYKFEQLVLDMIHDMESCLPFEVERNKEFAPIKNRAGVDSVDTARKLLEENGVTL